MAKINSLSSQQLGRLGETAVALELMKRGFDVINLNDSLQNYKHADLFCAKDDKTTLIQVKTGSSNKIYCGLTANSKGYHWGRFCLVAFLGGWGWTH